MHPEILLKDLEFREESDEVLAANLALTESERKMAEKSFIASCKGTKGEHRSVPFEAVRKEHPGAYRAWTEDDDAKLWELFNDGWSVEAMAEEFGRKPGAIHARLKRLGS